MNRAEEAMNVDQFPAHKARSLKTLTDASPFSSSITKLSGSSLAIPFQKDFHFYVNFDEFKVPIQQISQESQSMLSSIGSSAHIWGKEIAFPGNGDLDDGHDWLVNVNDEVFERFDVSADEFLKLRKEEEETGKPVTESDDGFQLVCGKKKKNKGVSQSGNGPASGAVAGRDESTVKVATTRAKQKVPFHIPTIKKPQEEFNILVNNSNQPFDHVWLLRSEDGQRFIHPLENLSVLDFLDKDIWDVEPIKPPSIESTPFKLVEEVKDLKELATKLHYVNEFAVDLEHNQYRSFQGLTCLMQISTRTEDFIVDTLKLRIHVGPYLREVFKDPTKKKVMHGADRDVVWLQRDFGIYICNMFDTGQASRVLKLERNSLEYLLQHFCGVTANKEYQNADWRLRSLPDEMVRYAREDTHYLLYIYDLMKIELFSMPKESTNADPPLLEVYKRSSDLCMQLYEKELLTEDSFLYIHGLQGAGLSAQQLAVVAGLCEWRDAVARSEDESTGYILPNRTLLEIAKQMPTTTSKLHWLVKSKHSYIERNLASVVSIIRHSMLKGAAFESAAEHLRQERLETVSEENTLVDDGLEADPHGTSSAQFRTGSINNADAVSGSTIERVTAREGDSPEPLVEGDSPEPLVENGQVKIDHPIYVPELPSGGVFTSPVQSSDTKIKSSLFPSSKVTGATVHMLKKPSRAFGALLGTAASKRKFDTDKKEKEEMKLEQIRSSMKLPFHSFIGRDNEPKPIQEEPPRAVGSVHLEDASLPVVDTIVEEITMLDDNTNTEDGNSENKNDQSEKKSQGSASELYEEDDEPMSLSDLSSSFQECFQNRKARTAVASEESGGFLALKPFDYEAARKQVSSYGDSENSFDRGARSQLDRKKKGSGGRLEKDDSSEFPQGRRRQAFPATGNRSATFR